MATESPSALAAAATLGTVKTDEPAASQPWSAEHAALRELEITVVQALLAMQSIARAVAYDDLVAPEAEAMKLFGDREQPGLINTLRNLLTEWRYLLPYGQRFQFTIPRGTEESAGVTVNETTACAVALALMRQVEVRIEFAIFKASGAENFGVEDFGLPATELIEGLKTHWSFLRDDGRWLCGIRYDNRINAVDVEIAAAKLNSQKKYLAAAVRPAKKTPEAGDSKGIATGDASEEVKSAEAKAESPKSIGGKKPEKTITPRLDNWAFAAEDGKTWWLFHLKGRQVAAAR